MGASTGANGNRWTILILVFTTRIALGFQFQTMGSVADPAGETLALSHAETGTLVGLYLMPGFVLAIPAGLLGRWVTDRWLLGAGLLLVGIGGLVAAGADGFAGLAAGRLVQCRPGGVTIDAPSWRPEP
jgi:predicted MFS family arabinose efflux permease